MVVKFILWIFGLCLTAIPLLVSIVVKPSDFGNIFIFDSYLGFEAELLFIGVSLGAVTVAEIFEMSLDLKQSEKARKLFLVLLFVVNMILLILCAVFYGKVIELDVAGKTFSLEDLEAILLILSVTVIEVLVFKLVLWGRKA